MLIKSSFPSLLFSFSFTFPFSTSFISSFISDSFSTIFSLISCKLPKPGNKSWMISFNKEYVFLYELFNCVNSPLSLIINIFDNSIPTDL